MHWGLIAVFVAALLLRFHYDTVAVFDFPLRGDAQQYFRIAYNVVEHGTFSTASPAAPVALPDSYRAPGYPAFIAFFLWCFGDIGAAYDAVLAAQCALGALVAAMSTWLASRIMPLRYALIAGALVALWPHLISMGAVALTETLFGFLLMASACLLIKAVERPRVSAMIAAGGMFAAAALVNQIAIGLVIVCCAGLAFLFKPKLWVLLFALAALGPPGLWAIRDSGITPPPGRSATTRLMENVLIGMEPDFAPRYMPTGSAPTAVAARGRIEAELKVFERDKLTALVHIGQRVASHPFDYLLWYAAKPAQFWSWSIVQGAGEIAVFPLTLDPFAVERPLQALASICHTLNGILMFASFGGLILALGLAGFARGRSVPAGAEAGACWIVVLAFLYAMTVHSILTPDVRYAVPFRPFEFVLATFFLASVARWLASVASKQGWSFR
jgi:hypothetical protein